MEKHEILQQAERRRYTQNWDHTLNAEGKQPLRQLSSDHEEAKRQCQRVEDEFMATKGQLFTPIHESKQRRQNPNQQFQRPEENDHLC